MAWRPNRGNHIVRLILLLMLQTTCVISAQNAAGSEEDPYSRHNNPQYEYSTSGLSGIQLDENSLRERALKHSYDEKTEVPKAEKKEKPNPSKEKSVGRKKQVTSFWSTENGKITAYVLSFLAISGILIVLLIYLRKQSSQDKETALAYASDRISKDMLEKLDVDVSLEEALKRADYRFALRVLYLKNLKLLMTKGLVRPSLDKTNTDYVREIKEPEFREEWRQITDVFERIWYGNQVPDKNSFSMYRAVFDRFFDLARLR